jgi:hypothetical protein
MEKAGRPVIKFNHTLGNVFATIPIPFVRFPWAGNEIGEKGKLLPSPFGSGDYHRKSLIRQSGKT